MGRRDWQLGTGHIITRQEFESKAETEYAVLHMGAGDRGDGRKDERFAGDAEGNRGGV